ncbi:MAG: hypothetical protein VKL42_19520 [Snowella sp.]|nr:hypothetical protein [Snowella sp.]
MLSIKTQIVTDEASKPVAVVINYHDWQKIEALLVDRQVISSLPKSPVEENLDVFPIMQLAETGFAEWNDPEEDIYNDVT